MLVEMEAEPEGVAGLEMAAEGEGEGETDAGECGAGAGGFDAGPGLGAEVGIGAEVGVVGRAQTGSAGGAAMDGEAGKRGAAGKGGGSGTEGGAATGFGRGLEPGMALRPSAESGAESVPAESALEVGSSVLFGTVVAVVVGVGIGSEPGEQAPWPQQAQADGLWILPGFSPGSVLTLISCGHSVLVLLGCHLLLVH